MINIEVKMLPDCEDLLPVKDGCFFGNQEYNWSYYNHIEYTIDILEEIIKNTDWDNDRIIYYASW